MIKLSLINIAGFEEGLELQCGFYVWRTKPGRPVIQVDFVWTLEALIQEQQV
jgi:hypothetical protein